MLFSRIPGQEEVKNMLVKAHLSNRIGHALLFNGSENGAQLAMAVSFVQYILCSDKTPEDACGECPSCVKMNHLTHPDVHFIFPTATTKEVSKDPNSSKFMAIWRESLQSNPYISLPEWIKKIGAEKKLGAIPASEAQEVIKAFALKGYESLNRVMIIWKPELMNLTGLNKLLKIIEEPPENAYIFLVSERHENLPQTILSRLQKINIRNFTAQEIIKSLKPEFPDVPEQELNRIANQSGGNISHARDELIGTDQSEEYMEKFIEWSRMCFKGDVPKLIKWTDEIARFGREWHLAYLNQSLHILRECLIANYGEEKLQHGTSKEFKFIKNFAPFIHSENLNEVIHVFEETVTNIIRNANARIIFMDLSIQMTRLLRIKNVPLSNSTLPVNS